MKNLKDMTDEELALSYVDGNNKAFDLLLSRNQQNLFSYILFVVHDRETADDIFQETFIKVITRLQEGRYVVSGKFSAWVMRIAHNAIMDWYRDQSSRCIVKAGKDNDLSNIGGDDLVEGNIESAYVNRQVMNDVRRLLDMLPPILFVVHDRETADDIFQETFIKVITRLQEGRYVVSGKFSAWVMRIAHNAIMDWYRDQSSRCIVKAGKDNDLSNIGGDDLVEGNIESAYVNRQVMNDVRRLLDMLPPIQREVVYMRYYQQLSFKEIADTTSVSINTALGRMRYALLNMRRMAKSNGISLQLM